MRTELPKPNTVSRCHLPSSSTEHMIWPNRYTMSFLKIVSNLIFHERHCGLKCKKVQFREEIKFLEFFRMVPEGTWGVWRNNVKNIDFSLEHCSDYLWHFYSNFSPLVWEKKNKSICILKVKSLKSQERFWKA